MARDRDVAHEQRAHRAEYRLQSQASLGRPQRPRPLFMPGEIPEGGHTFGVADYDLLECVVHMSFHFLTKAFAPKHNPK